MKIKVIFIICLFFNLKANDPFSEINIKSQKAICKKNSVNKNIFDFTYLNNVLVSFADKSKIKSEKLNIKINIADKTTDSSQKSINNITLITFSKNVFLKKEQLKVTADKAEIFPSNKKCKLTGNVYIEQTKKNQKDLPIITKCDNANIDLITQKITFQGDTQKPVSTTIKLKDNLNFTEKNNNK